MSIIKKEYWSWDESYNNTEFKLGQDISDLLISKSIVQFGDDKFEYKVLDSRDVDLLKVKNNRIVSIYFSRNTKFFVKEGLLELKYEEFKIEIEKIFEHVEKDYEGNKIFVVFRDGFVTFIAIVGNENNSSK